ncbi:unnamed protein product [Thlaspi arvense]|uniref:Synergin gamma C-terminal domain-containing protein n=1 Tax=Thlaspi arvense TaxID=13288 RepID=A0AAU9RQP0_THLAR|nr:unnamed protein product [Thlaspi arvense]
MNGLDFFFSPSATVDSSTGNNGEGDDDWGDFVDSSPNPIVFSADRNGADSTPNRIDSEKKSQAQWVTPRGPVPLSVFGEEEEDDESGAPVSSFKFSFDSFSGKHNDSTESVKKAVSTNPTVEISGLIADLYRENGRNEQNSPESLSSRTIENSDSRLENLSWNPLNLDTERSEKTSNGVNSNIIGVTLDSNDSDLSFVDRNDDDGWEFKTAESKEDEALCFVLIRFWINLFKQDEQENVKSGSVLSSSFWSSPTNATDPNFDNSKIDVVKSGFDLENGDDDDTWGNGGWEFTVAESIEPKNDSTNKESNGWEFRFDFEPASKFETTTSFQSNVEKATQKRENSSISSSRDANVNSGGDSWAFNQPSLETAKEEIEEKEVQINKPKGVLPLSFFEDEKLENTLFHEDNFVSVSEFSARKAPNPNVSINDLLSSLYSQVEEKNAVNLSQKSANGEDDSWEFQGPTKTIAEGGDDFDSTWEFQGPSLALNNSDVTEGVDEFDDDSWEYQGPTQPVRDSTSRKGESKHGSVENEVENRFSVPNGFRELHEKPVISIEPSDFQDLFQKLKTELYYIALNHLESLKEARDLAADSNEVAEVKKCDGEIRDLQNFLNNDVLIREVNVESLQHRPFGITELYKALQEPKFRALDSEDLLSERLLLVKFRSTFVAEKDSKSTIELLKHATSTLKILNLGSSEQQSKYTSSWFVIASTCAQELRHAASIWKEVIENDVQEEILSKPQGKSYVLSVGEIYRIMKIMRASTRLYKLWILLAKASSNVLAVLDECAELWLSSGLDEALRNNINCDHSADQFLESIECIDEIDAFKLHTCITSTTSPTCYISGLNTEIVPGIKMVKWNEEHYLVPLANLWANLISRDPPDLPGHRFPAVS